MRWQPRFGQAGDWHWHGEQLPNGWTPSVHDNSQMSAPHQATLYDVAATCSHWLAQGPRVRTLAEAKCLAIDLAFEQVACCAGLSGMDHAPAVMAIGKVAK